MRRIARFSGATVMALVMSMTTVPAEAAVTTAESSSSSTVSRSFASSTRVWSKRFDTCLWMTFKGKLSAKRYRYMASEGPFWVIDLKEPRISDPTVKLSLRKTCKDGAALKRRHSANTIRYAGFVYGYKCSYDPTYSVSAPWGVSVGVTPDCGDERVAKHGDFQRGTSRAHTFRLHTDGVAVGWDGRDWIYEGQGDVAKVCTSISGYFVLRDTKGAVRKKHVIKAGLRDQCVRTS
jgi:hypothetical protein